MNRPTPQRKVVEHPAGDALHSWRRRALDLYAAATATVQLLALLAAAASPALDWREYLLPLAAAWSLTLGSAVLRRVPVGMRTAMIVVSGGLYGLAMLGRTGVFMHFRLVLAGLPMLVLVLGGVRPGLLLGAASMLLTVGAFAATEAGFLRQVYAWQPGDWSVQSFAVLGQMVPALALIAGFSHHLNRSIRREQAASEALRAEAARRQQLEREVLQAAEQESVRIGSELHDGVCQDLTALLIRARRSQKALATQGSGEARSLELIVAELGRAIGAIHGISCRLSPGSLDGSNLDVALAALVQRYSETVTARMTFRTSPGCPFTSPEAALHLYRIAQEAIANAARHSSAKHIEVSHECSPESQMLRVDDDGRGFQRPHPVQAEAVRAPGTAPARRDQRPARRR